MSKNRVKQEIGVCGVDAGMLLIGDPCYFVRDEEGKIQRKSEVKKSLGDNAYSKLCEKIGDKSHAQLHYAAGHEGMGVLIDVDGDGNYPVVGVFEEGKLCEVRIRVR
jgi:hypothetical protein